MKSFWGEVGTENELRNPFRLWILSIILFFLGLLFSVNEDFQQLLFITFILGAFILGVISFLLLIYRIIRKFFGNKNYVEVLKSIFLYGGIALLILYSIFSSSSGNSNEYYNDYDPSHFDEPLTSDNWDCTSDCSGHEAGYEWAEEKGITDPDDCGGNSNSFIEGCEAYANEYNLSYEEEYYDYAEEDYYW